LQRDVPGEKKSVQADIIGKYSDDTGGFERDCWVREEFTILIADRNPHVRKFLEREITAEGYGVRVADKGRQVIEMAYGHEPVDLLLIDPDFADTDGMKLLKKLQDRIPVLPVIVHAFPDDYDKTGAGLTGVTFVEKRGNSIEHLKPVIREMLGRYFPGRSAGL